MKHRGNRYEAIFSHLIEVIVFSEALDDGVRLHRHFSNLKIHLNCVLFPTSSLPAGLYSSPVHRPPHNGLKSAIRMGPIHGCIEFGLGYYHHHLLPPFVVVVVVAAVAAGWFVGVGRQMQHHDEIVMMMMMITIFNYLL